MVAVAVLAIAILPLLDVQGQITRTYQRFVFEYERATVQRNALAVLREINARSHPEGRVELAADQVMTWTSQLIAGPILNAGYPTGDGVFLVSLYLIEARVERASWPEDILFKIERIGWEKIVDTTSDITRDGRAQPLPP
jgi:hypothetical protein